MATTYTKQGETWYRDGEPVAHYPEMLADEMVTAAIASGEERGILSAAQADELRALRDAAWPMVALDTPEQHGARVEVVGRLRRLGLLP